MYISLSTLCYHQSKLHSVANYFIIIYFNHAWHGILAPKESKYIPAIT